MRSATISSAPLRRPVRTTVAPSRASAIAPASPMPLPAPVTQAIFPLRFCHLRLLFVLTLDF